MIRQRLAAGRYRIVACFCASSLILTACADQGISGQPLTPAQQQLKQANQRFNQTVAEGAIAGAVVGGILGAVLGGRNAAAMAAVGAGAGAVVGGAAGYAVARNNYEHAQTEGNLKKAIGEANDDAAAYQRSADASTQIASDARNQVAMLDAQYQQKSITASQYRQNLASYRESADIMQKQLGQMDKESASLRSDAANVSSSDYHIMIGQADQIDRAKQKEQRSYQELEEVLASGPAG